MRRGNLEYLMAYYEHDGHERRPELAVRLDSEGPGLDLDARTLRDLDDRKFRDGSAASVRRSAHRDKAHHREAQAAPHVVGRLDGAIEMIDGEGRADAGQ